MVHQIAHHRLLSDYVQHESIDKHSGQFAKGLPDTIVLHYSGTGTLQTAVNAHLDPDVKASVHVVIGRNGSIVQLLPFDRIAWHAGVSEYQGRKDINRYSIGIELENAGRLIRSGDQYAAWFGRTYGEEDVIQATHQHESQATYWHRYSEAQIIAVMDICRLLTRTYGITNIVGHDDVSPDMKIDPGPAFPMNEIQERLLFNDRREGIDQYHPRSHQGVVYHQSSPLFAQPDISSPAVGLTHLEPGKEVTVIGEQNGWFQVSVPAVGWLRKEHVKLDNEQLLIQQVIDV